MAIDRARISSIVESLVFVSETPLSFRKIRSILEGVPTRELQSILAELEARYREEQRGILLEEVAEGYQFRTPPENQEWVKMLVEYKPMRLSRAALETLAIIAYQQPATKTEVEAIRGVDSSSAAARLLELNLIKILGRKEMPGRPFIYGTTPDFLEVFNLANLGDLPNLRELEDIDPKEIEAYTEKLASVAGDKVEAADEDDQPAASDDVDQMSETEDNSGDDTVGEKPETTVGDEPAVEADDDETQ